MAWLGHWLMDGWWAHWWVQRHSWKRRQPNPLSTHSWRAICCCWSIAIEKEGKEEKIKIRMNGKNGQFGWPKLIQKIWFLLKLNFNFVRNKNSRQPGLVRRNGFRNWIKWNGFWLVSSPSDSKFRRLEIGSGPGNMVFPPPTAFPTQRLLDWRWVRRKVGPEIGVFLPQRLFPTQRLLDWRWVQRKVGPEIFLPNGYFLPNGSCA